VRMETLYHWQISEKDVLVFPGVVTGLNWACHAIGQPGDAVVVQTPIYPPFLEAPLNAKRERIDVDLIQTLDGSYTIDFERFEAAITERTRLFLLCNPHNPSGRVFTKTELERLAEICQRHDLIICSDEIHGDLIYSGRRHLPIASLSPEIAARTITLFAPSKTFNLAGLGCSFAIVTNPDLRARLNAAREGLVGWVNVLGATAAQAAYREGGEWLSMLLAYLEGNRDALVKTVNECLPGVCVSAPEGTYLAWLDCREAGLGDHPARFFAEKARVGLNEGVDFGSGGAGFVRLNFGCPRATLDKALERMATALAGQRRR
ncbi:MAG TPA: PatB family C-S lyase, partial [Anaerolineaceae bacterium]|nr:PatB family C-S lyase [Anaerolineaceae bacterium]